MMGVIAFCNLTSPVLAAGNAGLAQVAFSKGLLAYNQKNFIEAAQEFQTAVNLEPEKLPTAHLFLGLSLWQLGKTDEARPHFQAVINTSTSATDKQMAQNYLGQKKSADRRLRGNVSVAALYDSNVTLEPSAITVASLPSSKDDFVSQTSAGISYQMVAKKNYGFIANASYSQSIHADLDQFNYGLAHVDLTENFAHGNFWASSPLIYEYSLLGTNSYLNSYQWKPSLGLKEGKHFITVVRPWARRDAFLQDTTTHAQDRDAWSIDASVVQYFMLNQKQTAYISAGYTLESNLADGNDWDYTAHKIDITVGAPLFAKVNASVSTSITADEKYKHTDSIIGTKRSDDGVNITTSLSRELGKNFTLAGSYSFMKNNSNIAYFEYTRHLAGVTLAFRF